MKIFIILGRFIVYRKSFSCYNVTMIQKQANKNDASLMFEVVEEKLIKKEEVKDILAED